MGKRFLWYSVEPVQYGSFNGTGYTEVSRCEPEDADAYAVYGRRLHEGFYVHDHIGDCALAEEAYDMARELNRLNRSLKRAELEAEREAF